MTVPFDTVITLAARGEGRTESGHFVPLAAPGDWLDAEGVLHNGPHHVPPACPHFPGCGGCQLQHVDDGAYARWMVERIAGALEGQGLPATEILAPHLSPPRSRRRATMRVLPASKGVLIGFNAEKSKQIVDIRDCAVLHPQLQALLSPLRKLLGARLSRHGAELTLLLADQGVDLLIKGLRADGLQFFHAAADFAAEHRLARFAIDQGDGPETLWEPDPVTVTLGGAPIAVPHGTFLQATADAEAVLVDHMLRAVGAAERVDDLFAGLGTFALALSAAGKRVRAVEGSRAAAQALTSGAGRARRPIETLHRDLYRRPMTAAELAGVDSVVIDPPRAGAEEQVKAIAESHVQSIGYVSCNPASFARDCRKLAAGGYALRWIAPVGQFRWSTHMELAACLTRQ